MTDKDPFLNICDKTKWFFGGLNEQSLANEEQKNSLEAFLSHVRVSIDQFVKVYCFSSGNPTVAFCGKTNVGKSTLMNALLGDEIAPVRNGDWSSRPVEYSYADIDNQEIFNPAQFPPVHIKFKNRADLERRLTDLSTQGGRTVGNKDLPLAVRLNAKVLEKGITIADLPGFNATDGSESSGNHDSELKRYLERGKDYLQIFLVCHSQIPDDSEIQFIKDNIQGISGTICLIINYRKGDNIGERKNELMSCWRQILSGCQIDFLFLNAKEKINSELNVLFKKLNSFSDEDSRKKVATESWKQLFRDVKDYLEYLHIGTAVKDVFLKSRTGILEGLVKKYDNPEMIKTFEQFLR